MNFFSVENKDAVSLLLKESYYEFLNPIKEADRNSLSSSYPAHGMFGTSSNLSPEINQKYALGGEIFDHSYNKLSSDNKHIEEEDFSAVLTEFLERANERGDDTEKIKNGIKSHQGLRT